MKTYKVEIKGISPYMQHRMDDVSLEQWEKKRGLIIERPDVDKSDLVRAEFHCYKDDKGYYIPSEQIKQSLINSGSMTKAKVGNAKKSMKNIVAGQFQINEEKIYISDNYVIDKRSAVNNNNKARIIVIRPKWENWGASFTLTVDNDTLTTETINEIITNAGNYIGIGSYRPQKNGSFGRFQLSQLQLI